MRERLGHGAPVHRSSAGQLAIRTVTFFRVSLLLPIITGIALRMMRRRPGA